MLNQTQPFSAVFSQNSAKNSAQIQPFQPNSAISPISSKNSATFSHFQPKFCHSQPNSAIFSHFHPNFFSEFGFSQFSQGQAQPPFRAPSAAFSAPYRSPRPPFRVPRPPFDWLVLKNNFLFFFVFSVVLGVWTPLKRWFRAKLKIYKDCHHALFPNHPLYAVGSITWPP